MSTPVLTCTRPCATTPIPLSSEEQEALKSLQAMEPWLGALKPPADGNDHMHEFDRAPGPDPSLPEDYWPRHFREFCDEHCLQRYLRANQWRVNDANAALVSTLRWRQKFRPHLITPAEVSNEACTGKNYLNNFDKCGRPVIYLRNYRQNTTNYRDQIRFLVFNVESAIRLMPSGVEKVTLVFDFKKYSARNAPPMHVSKYFLHLFAAHYPERLGVMFACDAPWYFWVMYKVISPFIHPVTKAKIRFVQLATMDKVEAGGGGDSEPNVHTESGIWSNLYDYIDRDCLEADFRGDLQFNYDHATYWPHLERTLASLQQQ